MTTDTLTNLCARQLMCDVIESTIRTAMGEVSAFVEDPADNRARREAIQDARDYIASDEFQALCDDLLLPDDFVEQVKCKVFFSDKVWQPRLIPAMVEA